jgi:muramoyltetrapeptide carboxypeptidase
VAVVAPSGVLDPQTLADGCRILRGWGLEPEPAPHLLDRHDELGYLAGPDSARAKDLQQAWLDPGIGAVLCARGGYGAQRIADLLDWPAMGEATAAAPPGMAPKVLAGFSDITALHEAFALRLGVATLHGPNVGTGLFIDEPQSQEGLRAALLGGAPGADGSPAQTVLTAPVPERAGMPEQAGIPEHSGCLVPGWARGVTAGGTLSLLAANLGTADGRGAGGFAGCILLLEDVNEPCYRLDRLLTQLLRSGSLDGVAGIALGSWSGCGPAGDVRALMLDRLGPLGVPVAWELGFGHCSPQQTVPLGVPATLDAGAGTLTVPQLPEPG